jgi:Ca-activated chloride channel family protein
MDHTEPARLQGRDGTPVVFEGVKAEGDLRGVALEMCIEQRFRNPGDTAMEVVYTFPLPWGAVLLGVDVLLGQRRLSGTVVEKKEAEARYEEVLAGGDAAIMLERNHDRSYSLNLGNLAAGEACVVHLRYAQLLQFEQRGLRVMIPTVIAPRYGGPVADRGLQPHQVPVTDLRADYPFAIVLRLHGELARARVASPSHPVAVANRDGICTLSLARSGALDRDFVVVVDALADGSSASIALQSLDGVHEGQVVALASFCPRIEAAAPLPVAAKILVDCSGSMAGDSIDAARRALQAIVLQLGAADRFSLSRFGSTVAHRARGLWRVTDATRLAAQRWVGALQADMGGTEMEGALVSTFALTSRAAGGVTGDVLLITDGEISAIERTVAAARASGHRLVVGGAGSSPAESHLRRLAEATGGACDFVAAGEAVAPAVVRMFARLRSPRLTQVRLAWPRGVEPLWVSPVNDAVFDADSCNVFALLPAGLSGALTLQGTDAEGRVRDIATATFDEPPRVDDLLPRLAAGVRIEALSDASAATAAELAVAYQLVTSRTNFLLVHERAAGEKASDMPLLHPVAQMVPAGWGGAGRVLRSRAVPAAAGSGFDAFAVPGSLSRPMAAAPTTLLSLAAFDMPESAKEQVRRDPAHWLDTEDDPGLTPVGAQAWLQAHAQDRWPRSYAALRDMGLSAWVLEWLELRIGAGLDEAHVVQAFCAFMAAQAFDDHRAVPAAASGGPSVALQERLASELQGLAAGRWPDAVYALQA